MDTKTRYYRLKTREETFNWSSFYWLIRTELATANSMFFTSIALDIPRDVEEIKDKFGGIGDFEYLILKEINIEYVYEIEDEEIGSERFFLGIEVEYVDSKEGIESLAKMEGMFRDLTGSTGWFEDDDRLDLNQPVRRIAHLKWMNALNRTASNGGQFVDAGWSDLRVDPILMSEHLDAQVLHRRLDSRSFLYDSTKHALESNL